MMRYLSRVAEIRRQGNTNHKISPLLHFAGVLVIVSVVIGYEDVLASSTVPSASLYSSWGHDASGSHMLDARRGLPVPRFTLQDQHGQAFTQDRMRGKWSILFFGYTRCADFCPTTLIALNNAYQRLERDNPDIAARLQVIFVSVDPFRDTPETLANYVSYFNPRFMAATGSTSELYRLTRLLGTDYNYVDAMTGKVLPNTKQQPAHEYLVIHGAGFYVFDEHARLVTWVAPPHLPVRIVSTVERLIGSANTHPLAGG